MPVSWDSLTGAESPRFWARKALTGDGASATPTNTNLDPLLQVADALLQSRYTCVGTTPWDDLTGAELIGWAQAVGYQGAAGELRGAQGGTWARILTELKQGTVQKKYASGQGADPIALAADIEKQATSSLTMIACIKEGRATANAGSLFGTAGRRSSIGSTETVQGRVLGRDRYGRLP